MAASKPGILHGLYTEQDIKTKLRCNHALRNLNTPTAHAEHEHLAFIIVFEHQKREELRCSENLHLLPLMTSAADYHNRKFRPNYTFFVPPTFGLPGAPEWPGPSPLLKGYLVPVFVEKTECPSPSASSHRMFQYLGYHRIVSIEYYVRSRALRLGAHEFPERLHKRFGELFQRVSSSPMPRLSKKFLDRFGMEDATLKLVSVEESKTEEGATSNFQNVEDSKTEEDAIHKERGSGDKDSVRPVVREEWWDEWDMVPEMRLMGSLDRDGWMMI